MGEITFRLRDATQSHKVQTVKFREDDNPLVSEFKASLSEQIVRGSESNGLEGETIQLTNKSRNKAIVEGYLRDQVSEDEEVIYGTDGVAGR
ncbi:hypothetical protein JW835_06905 [bacterium]|nr:hypothetical protein [bacterium]